MNKITLSGKFFAWLLLASILPTVLLAGLYLNVFKNAFLQQEQENLSQVADKKVNQIERYISERIADARLLSKTVETANALKQLISAYKESQGQGEDFIRLEKSFHKYFHYFQERGYYDIFLIAPDGEIVFTLAHEDDFATNIHTGPYRGSGLDQVVQRAKFLLEASSSTFNYYAPSNEAAAFIAAPVLQEGRLLGIVALQIDTDVIQNIALDVSGSMQSREVVIGSRQGEFFSYQVPLKYDASIQVGAILPMTELAGPLRNAMEGVRRMALDVDYRGIEVIAASRYIPSMNWGLVYKEDLAEVMQVVDQMIRTGVVMLIVLLLSVMVIAGYLGRWVAKPIVSMTRVSRAIAAGDMSLRVEPQGFKESFALAESFNRMSEHLQEARGSLEQKVEARTIALKTANTALKEENAARLEAENTLREREQNLAITLNSIGDAVITTDAGGRVTRMNPVAEQLTGWPLQEAQGRLLKNIFPILNAATRESIENPVEKVIATGETFHLSNHTTLIARDGTEYQISDSAAPIRSGEDNILGMVLVFNNVTEQYQLRQAVAKSGDQVRLLLNSTAEAIYGINIEGKCTFVNQSCLNMLGYKDESELLGKNMHNLMHYSYPDGSAYPVDKCHIFQAFYEKRGTHIDDEVFWRKDGSSFASEYWSHPIFKEDICMGAVVTFLDISAKKLADETIRRSQKMDALGKLTGGIAHDYNNMLGVVLGYAELLEGRLSDQPGLAKYAHEIHRAGERGAKLTKKLLAFSRQKSSAAERLDLNAVLQGEQHMMEKTLTVRIKLVLDLMDELWPVWLDSGDLGDAIVNLSINAMHAIEGSGQLTIQTRNMAVSEVEARSLQMEAGDYVLLSITDTGCGMNDATKEKIFDPFFSTKGDQGTGLGLSQVYGFVERSKGTIKVYTELGQGTRMALYFPRYCEFSEQDEMAEVKDSAVDLIGGEAILLVDDEPALLSLTAEILTQQGYRIFSAESAKQALGILEQETIDMLFSDVIMPEMDGYQLAAIVQEKYPEIKIQLASGFSDDRHMGIVDDKLRQNLLHKPVNAQTLLKRLRNILDNKSGGF
jgi:PAS domain S-box-containing protein